MAAVLPGTLKICTRIGLFETYLFHHGWICWTVVEVQGTGKERRKQMGQKSVILQAIVGYLHR